MASSARMSFVRARQIEWEDKTGVDAEMNDSVLWEDKTTHLVTNHPNRARKRSTPPHGQCDRVGNEPQAGSESGGGWGRG